MSDYKIYILGPNRRIVQAYDFAGIDDLSALDESKKHFDKSPVGIWDQARLVAKIEQGGEAQFG